METMSLETSKRSPHPAQGGRAAPLLSGIWGPVVAKGAIALGAVCLLAFVGARAAANPPGTVVAGSGSVPVTPGLSAIAAPAFVSAPPAAESAAIQADAGAASSPGVLSDGRVVLNAADEQALRTLPGIGPKRAQAILALRQRLVRFRAVEDLLRVKGIGAKTLAKIKPKVVLNAPG
jgi:competence protein ComEA